MKLIISIIVGFFVLIAVTQLLLSTIAFSLFVGIPAGILAAIATYVVLFLIKKRNVNKNNKK